MPRVKGGKMHSKKRRNILKKTKGYRWGRKNKIKAAKTAVQKAGQYAFRDRRVKKRTNRGLWLIRINSAIREYGSSYSKFMGALKKNKIDINRKMLSELAANHPSVFGKIAEKVK
jgi:large subunit ribosomal protein L20